MYTALFIVTLLLLTLYSLRFSFIQNKLLPKVKSALETELQTRVEIGSVDIALWDYLVIKDFKMYDRQNQLMIATSKVKITLINTSIPGWLGAIGSSRYLKIREIILDKPYFNLYRQTADEKLNLYFLTEGESDDSPAKPIQISVDKLILRDGAFNYIDSVKSKERLAENTYLNFIHLMLDSIQGEISFHLDTKGNIFSNITGLAARDTWSGFTLDTFNTRLYTGIKTQEYELTRYDSTEGKFVPYFCYEEAAFVNMPKTLIRAMNSRIDADIYIPGTGLAELLDDELQEDWHVHLRPSLLDVSLVHGFMSSRLPFHQPITLNGDIEGKINQLRSKNLQIHLLDSTFIHAQIAFYDLVEDAPTQMELKILKSRLYISEIQKFIKNTPIPDVFTQARDIRLDGSFTGLFDDFVARANIGTPEGNATADIHLNLQKPIMEWQGQLQAANFNLDNILNYNQAIASRLNLYAEFNGKGDNVNNIDGEFNLKIHNSVLHNIPVDSIYTILEFNNKTLQGPLDLVDSLIGKIHISSKIVFDEVSNEYEFLGDVQKLNLNALNLTEDTMRITSVFNIKFEGDSLDNLGGTARFFDAHISKSHQDSIDFRQLVVTIKPEEEGGKTVKIRSDILSLDLVSNIGFKPSYATVERLGYEAYLYFNNDDSLTNSYYASHAPDSSSGAFSVDLTTGNTDQVLRFFNLNLYIAPKSSFFCKLETGFTDKIYFNTQSDSIFYSDIFCNKMKIEGNIFKDASGTQVLAESDIRFHNISFSEALRFENINLEPVWSDDQIEFDLRAEQKQYQNKINVSGNLKFQKELLSLQIGAHNSTLLLNEDIWSFKGKNIIHYYSKSGNIELNDIQLGDSSGQNIHIYGSITKESGDGITIKVDNVKIETLNQLAGLGEEFEGNLNAQLLISDLLTDPYFQGFAFIKEFGFRKLQYGDVEANAVWNQTSEILSLDASLIKDNQKLFAITGHYATRDTLSPLNFKLASYNLPLKLAEPFIEPHVYDVKGTVELEEFSAKGTLTNPIITGNGYFKDVSLMVDYTKTRYNFTGNIRFNERNINFLNIRIFDERGITSKQNYANLNGYIYHKGFRDFKFNIELESIRNFMVFNTKQEDNELFYGKFIIKDGLASIDGDLNTIRLTTFVETGAGTELNIPLTDYTEGYTLDFVSFISDQIETEIEEKMDLTGFELKITVNATPDATVRIIFDEKTGEIIEARGNGNIDLEITPEGEFTMRGNYEVEKGEYLFTVQNGAINKKFFIEKGGKIIWTGSPYDATLNLKAYYQVFANISDLMGPNASGFRVPVRVLMYMNGSLMNPDIRLDIDIQNLNEQAAAEVTSRLRAITADPQQLNQQVFSLLLFSKFSPQQNTVTSNETAGRNTGLSSSVAEVVSNQLNYWIAQSLGNNLSANISSNQFQNLNVALEAKLFNDRVTVERNGAITSSANNDLTIGNINVQLRLFPNNNNNSKRKRKTNPNPGILAVEIFNREQFGFSGNNSISRGGGIFYRKDFDTFIELLRRRKQENAAPPPLMDSIFIDTIR
jgi:hypothetical protein